MQRAGHVSARVMLAALVVRAAALPPGTPVLVRLGQTISATGRSAESWHGALASDET